MDAKHLASRYLVALQKTPTLQEVAGILEQALSQATRGNMYERATIWQDQVRGAFRDPNVPKYGFDNPEDMTYQVKARQAMERWRNILDPLLKPFSSSLRVTVVSNEKGWIDTTIRIRN